MPEHHPTEAGHRREAGSPPGALARVSLSTLRKGQTGVVCGSDLSPDDAATLRAMGLCQDARIRLCRTGEPCIVAVGSGGSICGCGEGDGLGTGKAQVAWSGGSFRIGLARMLAERIFVSVDHSGAKSTA